MSALPPSIASETAAPTAVAGGGRAGRAAASLFRQAFRKGGLVSTGFYAGLATLVRLASGLVLSKVVAVYLGPAGLALVGQFQNFAAVMATFSTGGLNSGIVKYVAEFRDDDMQRRHMLATAVWLMGGTATLSATALILLREPLSRWLLGSPDYQLIFVIFGLTVGLSVLKALILSIMNGYRKVGRITTVDILGSLISLALTVVLASQMKVYGALLAIVLAPLVVVSITLALAIRGQWVAWREFLGRFHRPSFLKLTRFFGMAITTALTVPVSLILVRNHLVEAFSPEQAGYWQAAWKISETYLLLITTSLGIYYLPRLSEIRDRRELRREILHGYAIIMPVVIVMAGAMYLMRDWIIYLLFTPSFLPMRELFAFQLVGDCFKVASWLLGYVMLARAMTGTFMVTEVIFSASFVILSLLLTGRFGLIGMSYAFALNYFLYLLCLIFIFRSLISSAKT